MSTATRSRAHKQRTRTPILRYSPLDQAFAASMAKRATGVFAAAPIVQGNWDGTGTPDVLSFVRGNQVTSNWYDNFDPYQGGGFCDWTPEQATNARTGDAYIWYVSSDYYLLYDYTNDRYELGIGGQTMTVAAVLVAGTREILAWGFDTNNDLDGANYAYLSRNDAQTYGIAVQPTAAAPDATVYVGSDGTADPNNGIVEGLVFVREIPWTGAFGTNMGAGDIVAAHYAAGAGADVALSIGSWGTTFSLPTDAATGALVTGTGEAWSHPHADAELTDSYCETTYGASGWATRGTPSAGPADITAAQRIFNWGYEWTTDAADEGVSQTIAGLAAGENYVIRTIAHCAQANNIRVWIWDNTNGAQIGANFDFGATSSRTAPGVALFCFELPTIARNGVGADCVSINIRIVSTAAGQTIRLHQCELQENLIDNPSLETGAGNPWIPDGWTNSGLDVGDTQAEAGILHSGVGSIRSNINAHNEGIIIANAWPSVFFYVFGGWFYSVAGNFRLRDSNVITLLQYSNSVTTLNINTPGASWSHHAGIWRQPSGTGNPYVRFANGGVGTGYADDIYSFALDAVSLTATPASEANSTELLGRRVDGLDTMATPLPPPWARNSRLRGAVEVGLQVRHSIANAQAFGQAAELMLDEYEDANNYARADRTTNTVTVRYNAQGAGEQTGAWAAAGAWNADVKGVVKVKWGHGYASMLVDGVEQAVITGDVAFAADFSAALDWLSRQDGLRQDDAVAVIP